MESGLYSMLRHAHSGLRWVALGLLIYAVVNAFLKKRKGATFTEQDRKVNLFTLIFTHVQLVIGLGLYFISPKVVFMEGMMKIAPLRFYAVEHIAGMIIAIALITIGYSRAKRAATDAKKFGATFWFFLIGLIIILAMIPWPFRAMLGGGWF